MTGRTGARLFGARIVALLMDGPVTPRGVIHLLNLNKRGNHHSKVVAWLEALREAGVCHVSREVPITRSQRGCENVYEFGPGPRETK